MSGHKNFKILSDKLRADPERRAIVERHEHAMHVALRLATLRQARGVTQARLAQDLDVSQAHVSQVEHKDDLYLSTLRKYVVALGGQLELTAVFPDQTIRLTASPLSPDRDAPKVDADAHRTDAVVGR